jgi:hypothetical protein
VRSTVIERDGDVIRAGGLPHPMGRRPRDLERRFPYRGLRVALTAR